MFMPIMLDSRERESIKAIITEMKQYYTDVDADHFIDIVTSEAKHHGIREDISAPVARLLIEEIID